MVDSGSHKNFDAAHWLSQWLEQPVPSMGNAKPADYMDTLEGQSLVSSLINKMQTGTYT